MDPTLAVPAAPGLPLPLANCPECGGAVRTADYGAEWHLICRGCFKTLRIWSQRVPRWRDPAEAVPPVLPTPALPWPCCPNPACAGNLGVVRMTRHPEIWDLTCVLCAQTWATWQPPNATWHILTDADHRPTPADRVAASDGRRGARLPGAAPAVLSPVGRLVGSPRLDERAPARRSA